MTEVERYKRKPAIRCWIHHIVEGKYSEETRSLFTIFGKIKRIRIIATIVQKRESIMNQVAQEDDFIESDDVSNTRIDFDLDDGTDTIRAIIWRVDPEKYMNYKEGDLVDIVGLIRYWNGYISISPEIMKKVIDPNLLLLRNAEIIKKIKTGDIKEIPEDENTIDLIDVIPDEIDLNNLYEEEAGSKTDDIKEKIFTLIEEHHNGISFNDLKQNLNISDEDLKSCIRDLEMESRIYQSEENIFQSY
ncbi:MAG: hypothetical protein ACFFBP_09735 [Promethearchaeota archaeon]